MNDNNTVLALYELCLKAREDSCDQTLPRMDRIRENARWGALLGAIHQLGLTEEYLEFQGVIINE